MRIQTNIPAINAQRNLGITGMGLGKSIARLSSGFRINSAADDAAGLSISEKLRSQIRGMNQAVRNAQDGISMIQTAEGALDESHNILQRMRELAVQAASDVMTDADRSAIQVEIDQLIDAADRIATTTSFNTRVLLDGTLRGDTLEADYNTVTGANGFSGVEIVTPSKLNATTDFTIAVDTGTSGAGFVRITLTDDTTGTAQTIDDIAVPLTGETFAVDFELFGLSISVNEAIDDAAMPQTFAAELTVTSTPAPFNVQVGANAGESAQLDIGDMTAQALGVDIVSAATSADASNAITLIDDAIATISDQRSQLGATQNTFESVIRSLNVSSENLAASESRIRDLDVAAETVNFTKLQILQQAGTAVLAQANVAPQSVLQLLR